MKTQCAFFLISFLCLVFRMASYSQSADSTSISKSKKTWDNFNTMSTKYDTDSRIVKAKLRVPSLFGLGLIWGFGPPNYGLSVEYEKKRDTSWSYLAGIETRNMTQVFIKGGMRYYYDIEKRMKKLDAPINFSANYFSAEIGYGYDFRKINRSDENVNSSPIIELNLLFGLQRRVGRHIFIDVNGGPKITQNDFYLINISWMAGFIF